MAPRLPAASLAALALLAAAPAARAAASSARAAAPVVPPVAHGAAPAARAATAPASPASTPTPSDGAPPAPAAAPLRPPGAAGPLGNERLSDERRLTRWAHPLDDADVRAAPDDGSAVVGRLRWATEDGRPEVVVVLRARRADDDRTWLQVRFAPGGPGRPATGWVPRERLGSFGIARGRLVVDRAAMRARLEDGEGTVTWRARVGVGAPGTPTPAGRFFVRERLRGRGGIYGPWAIGTSAYARVSDWPRGGVVGLHGTDEPALIPGRPSHGCVRLRNADVSALARRVAPGTPVLVR